MIDLKALRENPEAFKASQKVRGEDAGIVDQLLKADDVRREAISEFEKLRAEQNTLSKSVGAAKGDEKNALLENAKQLATAVKEADSKRAVAEEAANKLALLIANLIDPAAPIGGEADFKVIETVGKPRDFKAEGFEPKDHVELGKIIKAIDTERGAKVAGAAFPAYRADGAALIRALINLFLDTHVRENGFTEIWPPILVNEASARGTGQIPDKEDQMYVVGRDGFYLAPTAEVPVTNLHRDEILDGAQLPIRYAAYTPCFRREAGAAGRETRGILRRHQFDKVEMVSFERPEESRAALEWLTERAEILLQRLELPYRVLLMATGDMGFVQMRKYDLEVWAAGSKRWLEVSSCSNFGDYQARRMAIRHRSEAGAKPELVHTLNGSGLAIPRVMAALLENGAQTDGSVKLPAVLHPYLGGRTHLAPPAPR